MPWLVLAVAMVLGSFADEVGGDDRRDARSRHLLVLQNQSLPVAASRVPAGSYAHTFRCNPIQSNPRAIPTDRCALVVRLFVRTGRCHGRSRALSSQQSDREAVGIRLARLYRQRIIRNLSPLRPSSAGRHTRDAATARRGERLRTFMARTLVQQFVQATRIEVARLRRRGLSPWSWRNRVLLAHIAPLTIIVLAGFFAGARGVFVIVAAGLLGRLFHELINYVQHFGLVRVENHPVKEHHSWDCHRTISNSLHYNLPRHSDHHMAASKDFWRLQAHEQVPMLPYGYQTMAFIALTPPLWRRIMRPLLADWDLNYASDAERDLVCKREWDGIA